MLSLTPVYFFFFFFSYFHNSFPFLSFSFPFLSLSLSLFRFSLSFFVFRFKEPFPRSDWIMVKGSEGRLEPIPGSIVVVDSNKTSNHNFITVHLKL